jgi:outer membrane protein assembly factor BamD (BamD/ComL family)
MSPLCNATWTVLAVLVGCFWAGGCASMGEPAAGSSEVLPTGSGVSQASYTPTPPTESPGLAWSDLAIDNWGKTAKKLTGRGPNRDVAIELYKQADAQYRQAAELQTAARAAVFEAAAPKFVEAAERWPDSALAMDALFMAGESMFFADNYPAANRYYEQLVKAFPNNKYIDIVDQRRYAIAKFWLEINRENPEELYYANFFDKTRPWKDARGSGIRVFDKIRVDNPTGRLSDDATLAIANENFARGKFHKADEYYTDLRKSFPASEHQFLAHFLGVKAKLSSYDGPAYSGAALDEAEKLIKQMWRQFPQESEKEREFLERSAAEVRLRKAQRLEFLAQYHDRRGEYRAARHYYAGIVDDFADTPLASRAETRMAEIASLPAVPPQQAQWLIDLLPETDNVRTLLEATEAERIASAQRATSETGGDPPLTGEAENQPQVAGGTWRNLFQR